MAKSFEIRRNLARAARKLAYKLLNEPSIEFETNEEAHENNAGKLYPVCAMGQIKYAAKCLETTNLPYVRRESHRARLQEAEQMIFIANDDYFGGKSPRQSEALVIPLLNFADVIDVKSRKKVRN